MEIVLGYKATDANIQCRGYQFVPGEWHEFHGELQLCKSGFHFCEQPSGPWSYYSELGTRVWRVEAREVLEHEFEPGADRKRVARYIRLVEEVLSGGNGNTGDSNTGDSNTGDSNTGDSNTGDSNTGHRNTGDSNTGNSNTGYVNTGDSNTGDSNTGDSNTGHRNTGYGNTGDSNTGDSNTGDSNTGHRNTGYGNATSNSSGDFCISEPLHTSFDLPTKYTTQEFRNAFGSICIRLCVLLGGDAPIRFDEFSSIPNITPEKLLALHEKHMQARR